MADGSGSGPLAGPVRGGILRDPVDLRDRAYEPTLARLAAELLPDARLVEIEDSYTLVPEDQPVRLAGAIREFVRETTGTRAGPPSRAGR